jgi:hypothetical protein
MGELERTTEGHPQTPGRKCPVSLVSFPRRRESSRLCLPSQPPGPHSWGYWKEQLRDTLRLPAVRLRRMHFYSPTLRGDWRIRGTPPPPRQEVSGYLLCHSRGGGNPAVYVCLLNPLPPFLGDTPKPSAKGLCPSAHPRQVARGEAELARDTRTPRAPGRRSPALPLKRSPIPTPWR